MCGIVTIASRTSSPPIQNDEARSFVNRLKQRGPDGLQTWVEKSGHIAMGHARLAIIDLETGAQPMVDAETGTALCFNGEIYNYRELRSELTARGMHFTTQSDSEVLLKAYLAWGEACFNRLDGMFAFTLYDPRQETLLFARDPIGIKPLYYSFDGDRLLIASELRAIALTRRVTPTLSRAGHIEYCVQGYVNAPLTILEGIHQLPPAHFAKWVRGELSLRRYHDWRASLSQPQTRRLSFDEAVERTDLLVQNAVKSQLVSDVPVGVLLSGGVDSSLVAAKAQSQATTQMESFTADFEESEYSESSRAQITAQTLGLRSHVFTIRGADLVRDVRSIAWASDAPIFDNSFFPTSELSRQTRNHVKVALSGDGGDELFLGYETYRADHLMQNLFKLPTALRRTMGATLAERVPVKFGNVSLSYKMRAFLRACDRTPFAAHAGWREILSESALTRLLQQKPRDLIELHPSRRYENLARGLEDCEPLSVMSYLDLETWLANDILIKTDRASMAHGLELRVPLLQKDLVHFALGLSDKVKFSMREPKRVLKSVLHKNVPSYPLNGKKRGFVAPMSEWLAGPLRQDLLALANSETEPIQALDRNELRRMVDEHIARRDDHGHALWALMTLDAWWTRLIQERA